MGLGKTPLSEFIEERSYLLLPLQNDNQYTKNDKVYNSRSIRQFPCKTITNKNNDKV